MSVALTADDRRWLQLPRAFPTADGTTREAWTDGVVERMRGRWGAALDADVEVAVRAALDHGLDRVLPEDSVTLQFWPTTSVMNAVVHVVYGTFSDEDPDGPDRLPPLLPDADYVTAPVTERLTTEALGDGVEARYLVPAEEDASVVLGGVNVVFQNSGRFVFVGLDATIPPLVGLALGPLRELIASIEVVDDDGLGPWERASVDVSELGRGETWSFPAAPAR